MRAAGNGHLKTVKLLLKNNAKIDGIHKTNFNKLDWTPLMLASGNGHIEVVKTLISRGADLEARDKEKWTALTWASIKGHL